MERIPSVMLTHAKEHPVLPNAGDWHPSEVRFSLTSRNAAVVMLRLTSAGASIRLRFDGVTEFALQSCFRDATAPDGRVGVRILDVSHLQWEGVTVRVDSSCGGLSFWAGEVRVDGEGKSSRRRASRHGDGPA